MEDLKKLVQYAPWPRELETLVSNLEYRPGWKFYLKDLERDPKTTHGSSAGGLTLVIYADVYDTYEPNKRRPVNHYFIVPAATYDKESWRRWLLDCILKVEQHEACEWFVIVEQDWYKGQDEKQHRLTVRPFAPNHGPGRDPYTIFEYVNEETRRTSFRGEVSDQ